jgi:hypothetical protein
MSIFKEQIEINAKAEHVWEVLANIGDIARWNPGVQKSWMTSEASEGLGASRRCELDGRNYLLEDVVEWNPPQSLTMRITETNMPFKRADIHFTLEVPGRSTVVTVSPDYELKFGFLGLILDSLFVRKTYAKGMRALLAGLKQQVEQP